MKVNNRDLMTTNTFGIIIKKYSEQNQVVCIYVNCYIYTVHTTV